MPGRSTIAGIRKDPLLYGVYSLSLSDIPGVVAANNFMSLFNPGPVGKFVVVGGVFFSAYGLGAATATSPMRGYRVTAASGGTQADPDTEINKYDSLYPPPIGVARYNNPTVTLAQALFNSPPPLGTTAAIPSIIDKIEPPPTAGGLILHAGEGVVLRTAGGDIDQIWNMTIVWGEGPGG